MKFPNNMIQMFGDGIAKESRIKGMNMAIAVANMVVKMGSNILGELGGATVRMPRGGKSNVLFEHLPDLVGKCNPSSQAVEAMS